MMRRVGVAVGLVVTTFGPAAGQTCPTMDEFARADRSQDLLLEFARAYGRSAGLSDLSKGTKAANELEVRLWYGFGLTGVDGFVLRRMGDRWTGETVTPIGRTTCYERRPTRQADWGVIWQQVRGSGLAGLPPKPSRDPKRLVLDGYSYVLEWWEGGRYRTFVYDNPDVFKTDEDLRMILIVRQLLGAAGVRVPGAAE